jgi:hypothetical protein
MAISSISSGSTAHRTSALNKKNSLQQRSSDFSSLASALSTNNLASAQNAFSALQKDAQSIPATQGSSQATAQSLQQVQSDARALAASLTSGNVGAAQKAFATLQQDSTKAHLHGHHHGGGGARVAGSANGLSGSQSSELLATQAIGSVGSTLNVTA